MNNEDEKQDGASPKYDRYSMQHLHISHLQSRIEDAERLGLKWLALPDQGSMSKARFYVFFCDAARKAYMRGEFG